MSGASLGRAATAAGGTQRKLGGNVGDVAIQPSHPTVARSRAARPRRRWALPLVMLPTLVAVATVPRSFDGEGDIKLLCVAAVAGLLAWRAADLGLLHRPWRRMGVAEAAALLFLAAATAATLTSDAPLLSVMGAPYRHNGLLAYTLAVVLLLVMALALPRERPHWVLGATARSLAVGAGLAVLYWFAQLAGWDPLGTMPAPGKYESDTMLSSTLGNPNFAGAFIAAALPGALWAALRPGVRPRGRLAWLAVAALLGAGVLGSQSLQAPVAAGAGVGLLAVAALMPRRRRAAVAVVALGGIAVLLLALGLADRGPLAFLGAQDTFDQSRVWDWTAAVRMVREQPLTGVGLARFGGFVRAYRPPGDLLTVGWRTYADAAHSVPLDFAATGGVPLLAAHLLLVGAVGWRLVRGLRTLDGDGLLQLGVFGGVWIAYQAQSLVSIDVVQTWFLHFLSAGAILALTAEAARPDGPLAADTAAPTVPAPRGRPQRAVATAVALAAIAPVLWLGRQSAAYLVTGLAEDHVDEEDYTTAVERGGGAIRLFPWDPVLWRARAVFASYLDDDAQELADNLEVLRRDPRDMYSLLEGARTAANLSQLDLATQLFRRALEVEPQAPDVKVQAAVLATHMGEDALALRLLDAALRFDPSHEDALALRRELTGR